MYTLLAIFIPSVVWRCCLHDRKGCKFSLQQSAQVLLGEINGRPDLTGNNLQKIKNSIGIGVLFSGEIVRLCGGYNYDSTSIRRPFDERSTAV